MAINQWLEKLTESIDVLADIFDTENYGLCVVDSQGCIVKWNYEKFLGKKESEVLGRHVEEVIENTRLHIVVKTGKKELLQLQKINGSNVIANRVPIIYQNEIVGAAGTIVFKDTDELAHLHMQMNKAEASLRSYRTELANMYRAHFTFDDIVTANPAMNSLKELCRVIARSDVSVLIQGESGTGKEMFAQAVHNASYASNEPFVSINCSSIPKELLESELFGYEAGAFTGAKKEGKIGKFELAGKGTIFLDELGTMPMEMQVKLLRVLENREFERVGGNRKITFLARVLAATNENIDSAIENKTFRSDLYYRLNVMNVNIPPLRERPEDIPMLCRVMLMNKKHIYHVGNIDISEETLRILQRYQWPGNVRELRNIMERAMLITQGETIFPDALPEHLRPKTHMETISGENSYFKQRVSAVERELIENAIRECEGNRVQAARQLGIHRSVLYKKMKDLNIHEGENNG